MNIKYLIIVLTTVSFGLLVPLVAQDEAVVKQREITPEEAKSRALAFLQRNVPLNQKRISYWGGEKCYHFAGPAAEPLAIDVDAVSGLIRHYSWNRWQIKSDKVVLTLPQARAKAEMHLPRQFNVKDSGLILVNQQFISHGDAGNEYLFEWRKRLEGIEQPFFIVIHVSSETGEVMGFSLIDYSKSVTPAVPKISEQEAVAIARKKCLLKPGYTEEAQLFIPFLQTKSKLQWRVTFKGIKVEPYTPEEGEFAFSAIQVVEIDTQSGAVLNEGLNSDETKPYTQTRPPYRPKSLRIEDYWPVPLTQGDSRISFITQRGANEDVSDEDFVRGKPGDYRGLLADSKGDEVVANLMVPGAGRHLAVASKSDRLAFDMYSEVYILDLKSGAFGKCNDSSRTFREMPSWDSTGTLLAMSGTHSPTDLVDDQDKDIFVSKIRQKLSASSIQFNRCVARMVGPDTLPIFSKDDRSVIFVHQNIDDKASDGNIWSIYRVATNKSYRDSGYQPPQRLVGLTSCPERLSWFPDGKRILVSYENSYYDMKCAPEIINIETKTRQTLRLPVLKDARTPRNVPLIPNEITIDPQGERLVFSAQNWSGNYKDNAAVYIYSCKLNGSDLKRVSAKDASSLKIHRYSQAGLAATNIWNKSSPSLESKD